MLVAFLILVLFAAGVITGWIVCDKYNESQYWDDDPSPTQEGPGGVYYTNTGTLSGIGGSGSTVTTSNLSGNVTYTGTNDVKINKDEPPVDED